MLLIICPTCQSDLVEESHNENIDCLRCGDEFSFLNAKYKHAKLTEVREITQPEPVKKIEIETPAEPTLGDGKGREEYLQIIKEFKSKHRRSENE